MTPDQRRAFIDTCRRMQPIAELERKARKAAGRRSGYAERADLSLATSWRWGRTFFADSVPPKNFCWSCHQFGRMPWIEAEKRYSGPITHRVGCVFAPDNGPYPGWAAAGRQILVAEVCDG